MLALKEPVEQTCTQTRVVAPVANLPLPLARVGDAANRLTLELYDAMEPLETEWRRLDRDALNSLHHSWDWCRHWVATHDAPVVILRGERAGRTLFLLPLEIRKRRGVRVAGFIAGDFSNLNTGLVSPCFRRGDAIADPAGFAASVAQLLTGRADLVALRSMPLSWRGTVNPFAVLNAIDNHNRSFHLPLAGDMDTTLRQVNAKRRRKKFRHQQRRLEALGGYEHVIAATPGEKAAILDLFFRQKAARFAALGLPDAFGAAETKAFFHALAKADDGGRDAALRLHALRLTGENEGHIAAIAGLSLKGDHVLCQFGSIDDSLAADTSPGEFLFWLMIEQCVNEGYALFDFGIGDQPYKRSWCSASTTLHDVLLPISTLGRAGRAVAFGLIHAKAFVKRHRRLYATIQRLRAGRSAAGEKTPDDQAA
ncbi:GNAT family N-acetyltransferase [Rhizobiaceae bacterium BDR2-2]|uniref:GNAT family N-acetyltransferase n=1 Tax=Ectorhizobium quercum TaxID=2965071 RepID=A0AAE3N5K2_9HYPH|nr:GNAT family N-acetyltransferase [Ectorhizobium quercum]MCX8998957.1 GNAT family N-acetyltransferase [Ectorhizobium quercum]